MRKLYTVNELHHETGLARSTIQTYLSDQMEIAKKGNSKLYSMKQIFDKYKIEHGRKHDPMAEQARFNKLRADKVEMENAKMRGELINVNEVVELMIPYIANCVTRLLSIPTRVAPLVAGLNKPTEISALVEDLIYESIGELRELKPSNFVGQDSRPVENTTETKPKSVGRPRKKAVG